MKQYSLNKRTFTSNLFIDRAKMTDGGTYVCRTSDMLIASTKVHVLNGKEKGIYCAYVTDLFNLIIL